MNEIDELKKDLDLIIAKATEYDKLDHKFKLVCGKRIEQTLQHLCMVGFGDGSKVNHEPVEVPELVAKYLDYARQCLDLNVLTVCNYQNVKSNMGKIAADKIVHWAHKHPDEFMIAYQTGNYTVAKEPLYYVELPNVSLGVSQCYLMKSDNNEVTVADNVEFSDMEFTEAEIKAIDERYLAFAVPVEEEAE